MAFSAQEVSRDVSTLNDGDVVFAALLCDLDSCLGPAVRFVWCTPELEARSTKQTASSRRAVIDVMNSDRLNRIAQRALAAHMLDVKLLDYIADESLSASSQVQVQSQTRTQPQAQKRYLIKTYLVPLRSDFEPPCSVTDMLFKTNDGCNVSRTTSTSTTVSKRNDSETDHDGAIEREYVAMCVLVFPICDGHELCGLVFFFDLHRPTDFASFECQLHPLPSMASQAVTNCESNDLRSRYGAWLRHATLLFSACFELKVRSLSRARSSKDCERKIGAFLSGACAVYACASAASSIAIQQPQSASAECHCSFVNCFLRTLKTCDRRFAEAAIAAHLAAQRTVVIGANFDAVQTLMRLLAVMTSTMTEICVEAKSPCRLEDTESDRLAALSGGIWRNELTRKGERSGLLSSLPDGAALIGLQGIVPPDGNFDSSLFVADELSVDNEFLFASDRPLAVVFVSVDRSAAWNSANPMRLTGAVYRIRDLPTSFRRYRDAYWNASLSKLGPATVSVTVPHRCVLRNIYVSNSLRRIVSEQSFRSGSQLSTAFPYHAQSTVGESLKAPEETRVEALGQSSVLVDALLSSMEILESRINPHAPMARSCVYDCLNVFWTDVRCRALALRRAFENRSALFRASADQSSSRIALQTLLGHLLDVRSETDFHILCMYLLRCDPLVFG